MLSVVIILFSGYMLGKIFEKFNLPKIIGMLFAGIIIGPFSLNLLSPEILEYSPSIRKFALVIILIKAGLTLNPSDLKKVGRPALLLSFLPALFEIIGYTFFANIIFNIPLFDSILMGTVLSAVSPAVVVPRMIEMIENKIGTSKGIPQMILAGASVDDIFVIVLFSSALALSKKGEFSVLNLLNIPISIVVGLLIGVLFGYILKKLFSRINNTYISTLILLITSTFFMLFEYQISRFIPYSALLAVISISLVSKSDLGILYRKEISSNFNKLWEVAQIFLFVLVGAVVDVRYSLDLGINGVLLILLTLIIRSIGVLISLIGTNLTKYEKIFCIVSYLPKATVQAAIGAIPLAEGVSSGSIILSIAVTGILITAPIGAIGIDKMKEKI